MGKTHTPEEAERVIGLLVSRLDYAIRYGKFGAGQPCRITPGQPVEYLAPSVVDYLCDAIEEAGYAINRDVAHAHQLPAKEKRRWFACYEAAAPHGAGGERGGGSKLLSE